MTGILDLMRKTTVADLEGVRSDFDDLPTPVFVRRAAKDPVREIDATAAERSAAAKARAAGRVNTDGYDPRGKASMMPVVDASSVTCLDCQLTHPEGSSCVQDRRSARQIEIMRDLHMQLADLDADVATQAVEYTTRMTLAGAWTPGRWNPATGQGNASRWIGNMIAKVRELKDAARTTPGPIGANDDASFQDIPNGNYAVADAGPDDIHFFRVSRFRDGGIKVQERASDTLYPVRRGSRRTGILNAIVSMGPRASMELYGQTIGRCGRCHITLTDALSRSRGIGPDCWGKM